MQGQYFQRCQERHLGHGDKKHLTDYSVNELPLMTRTAVADSIHSLHLL